MPYNRGAALEYAQKWAFDRNPRFHNFENIGGDCTNFVSQCIYAGVGEMNYTPVMGWFYNSLSDRSAAWSGVEYLFKFLTTNRGRGPAGEQAELESAQPGDVVQLCFGGIKFTHSLFVVSVDNGIHIATHSYDAYDRPIDTYPHINARLIRIYD